MWGCIQGPVEVIPSRGMRFGVGGETHCEPESWYRIERYSSYKDHRFVEFAKHVYMYKHIDRMLSRFAL